MYKIKKFVIRNSTFLIVFMLLIMPVLSLAQGTPPSPTKLVPCTNTPVNGIIPDADLCGFNALLSLVNTVINFILYFMAIPIAAIMFAYAGFLLVTAGGEAAGARTKAKSIFTNALIGLVLAAACWLIVKLILDILGYKGAWIGF